MSKFSTKQLFGIALLIAALLMFIDVPLIDGKTLSTIIVIISGLYLLFK